MTMMVKSYVRLKRIRIPKSIEGFVYVTMECCEERVTQRHVIVATTSCMYQSNVLDGNP